MNDFRDLPGKILPLKKKRNPATAAVIGFFFGGIGLGIYFASFIDFIIPMLILIGLYAIISQYGVIGSAIIASAWGYFRAMNSNERLAQIQRQQSSLSEAETMPERGED